METVHSMWRDGVTWHIDASSQDACPLTVRCWKRNTARGHATTAGCQPCLAIQGQHRSGVAKEAHLPHNARHTPISPRSNLHAERPRLCRRQRHTPLLRDSGLRTSPRPHPWIQPSIPGCGMISARSVPSTTRCFALMCVGMVNQRFQRPSRMITLMTSTF